MQIRGLLMSSTQPNFMSSTKIELSWSFFAETNETWQTNSSTEDTISVKT